MPDEPEQASTCGVPCMQVDGPDKLPNCTQLCTRPQGHTDDHHCGRSTHDSLPSKRW